MAEEPNGREIVADAEIQANPALRRQIEAGIYNVNLPVLQESVRLGVYDPPLQAITLSAALLSVGIG